VERFVENLSTMLKTDENVEKSEKQKNLQQVLHIEKAYDYAII
jgi:hypothetical protein